ncbi:MAG: ABC transporter permease [Candidatus Aenigmatarchaeota archaeon]
MKLSSQIKLALNIIIHNPLRSWLAIIGIVIGTAAIVAILSITEGAKANLEKNLNTLDTSIVTITPGFFRANVIGPSFRERFVNIAMNTKETKNLTSKDILVLKSISNVEYAMGIISGNAEATYQGKTSRVNIQGVDTKIWKSITTTELASGRYLIQGDINSVVVGSRISEAFSGMQINRQITIDGKSFKIIGILKESGGNDDNRIIMPIETALTVLDGKLQNNYDTIIVKIKDTNILDDTLNQINSKLMTSHGIIQESKKDFTISTPKVMQERISTALNTMSLFLTSIAGVSLIVGLVGVMNTIFTSVLEKTKEIGILKSIGAKNTDILIIFITNSAIIGLIGGIIGIILGMLASSVLTEYATLGSIPGRISLSAAYISISTITKVLIISLITGLTAGALPAYKASRLKPIDALRYE